MVRVVVVQEEERQMTTDPRRRSRELFFACFIRSLTRSFWFASFQRSLGKTGSSSSSKEPQFVLEDAIHAPESSFGGSGNRNPTHVFEVRDKGMISQYCRPSPKVTPYVCHRSPWSPLVIRTRNLPCFRVTKRTSTRSETGKAVVLNDFW
jgi:hypothetical protein